MEFQQARNEVGRILRADLADLAGAEGVSVVPPATARGWRIPERDKDALFAYGLPAVGEDDEFARTGADFQHESEPGYAAAEFRAYRIALCADVRIVCKESDGIVIAVPNFREMAGPLRDLHPEGISDEVVNGTVGAFVDFSWRWYWLSEILCKVRDAADKFDYAAWRASEREPYGAESGIVFDAYEPYRALCNEVRQSFSAVDQEALSGESSMWSNLIDGFD